MHCSPSKQQFQIILTVYALYTLGDLHSYMSSHWKQNGCSKTHVLLMLLSLLLCISVSSKELASFVDVSGPRSAVFESAMVRHDTIQDMHVCVLANVLL